MYWRLRSSEFSAARVGELREGLHELAEAGDPAPGLVALDGERAVGWVSLAPRQAFARLQRSRTIPRLDDEPVWSVVCFVVSPGTRGQGVAGRLLAEAMSWARDQGAPTLEAYPVDAAPGQPVHPDAAYTGTLDMFLRAGFRLVAATRSTAGGRPRVVVRAELAELPAPIEATRDA